MQTKLDLERLKHADRVWLFLDYDGTLAEFADTPDTILPDEALISLLSALAAHPRMRIVILSGRRLDQIEQLVPLPNVLLAGSYGLEMRLIDGLQIQRVDPVLLRPTINKLKADWTELIGERKGFFLEDKGFSLAMHARFASQTEAETILNAAKKTAEKQCDGGVFQFLGGHKFLEVAPLQASKADAVGFLMIKYAETRAYYIYIGDDDKDETAFPVIKRAGGLTIAVTQGERDTKADLLLSSPVEVREFLNEIDTFLNNI